MTTVSEQTTHCPICARELTVRHIMSTNNFGGQDSDFRSRPIGYDPLHLAVSRCPDCGYADYSPYFSEPRPLSDALKARIRAELKPAGEHADHKISHIYAAIAQIGKIREASDEELANLYLSAAWCCADEDDVFGEIAYRKLAIRHFESALANGTIRTGNLAVIHYLIGELYRRIGDVENAHTWFNRALAMQPETGATPQFIEMTKRQRDNPSDSF
jgi:tetratricopeptide (TPR) repeat protein